MMRFQMYHPSKLIRPLEEYTLPRREYVSEMAELPAAKGFITEDEINEHLTGGSDFSGSKGRIYAYYQSPQYIMGEIDVATYKSEKAACDAAILKAKNAHAAISAQAKKKKEEQNRQSSRAEVANAITDAEGLTPELVNLLIEKVYVFPDKRIEVAYKVQDLFD